MAPSQLLTVFGATGNQGGSVIANVLANPQLSAQYKIRGVNRDSSKPSAQKLAAQGVEMVQADLNDPESVKTAVTGSNAVFAVTNYWETMSKPIEVKQGRNIAEACKATGVEHLIWASLPHAVKLTNGELKHIEHFDSKAEIQEYIESIKGETGMTATYWLPGFFMSNLKGMISLDKSGVPTLKLPLEGDKTKVGLLDVVSDTGKFIAGVLLASRQKMDGFSVQGVSEWTTTNEIAKTISRVTGQTVANQDMSVMEYKGYLPESYAEEMSENMLLIRDWSYFGKGSEKNQGESNALLKDAKLTTLEKYIATNGPWEWK